MLPHPTPPEQPSTADARELATEVRLVVAALARQFRRHGRLPAPQLATLGWLDREGPCTASRLATLERVRPQSIAQAVGELEAAGLVERSPDPDDRRQMLIELTPSGLETFRARRDSNEAWLAQALVERLDEDERATLARAVVHLQQVIDD